MKGKPGPNGFREPILDAWETRFNLTFRTLKRYPPTISEQLCRCKDDEARRLILGVSE